MKSVVLHGGGLDSTLLVSTLCNGLYSELVFIHVNYGHLASEYELEAIKRQISFLSRYPFTVKLVELNLPPWTQEGQLFTGNHADSPVIPHRNEELIKLVKGR